ncbi:MAG TPA: phosphotransferase, partial [Bacillales bacterium]|nr:phosphotransferase [Bacillales bacterium]
EAVAELLRKIHGSQALLSMLKRLGKKPFSPGVILEEIHERRKRFPHRVDQLEDTLSFLTRTAGQIQFAPRVVCHCDVNHNNWLLGDDGHLYLIDWDNAVVADPALDLGMLLYSYLERKDWAKWCQRYGLELNEDLRQRMHWYTMAQVVLFMFWHRERGETGKEEHMRRYLFRLNRDVPVSFW